MPKPCKNTREFAEFLHGYLKFLGIANTTLICPEILAYLPVATDPEQEEILKRLEVDLSGFGLSSEDGQMLIDQVRQDRVIIADLQEQLSEAQDQIDRIRAIVED